jgi:hypothetical protein
MSSDVKRYSSDCCRRKTGLITLSASVRILAPITRVNGLESIMSKNGNGVFSRTSDSFETRDISSLKLFSPDSRYGSKEDVRILVSTDNTLPTC